LLVFLEVKKQYTKLLRLQQMLIKKGLNEG